MRITVLGSASGISMPGRGHASVAVECGSGLYMLDLGEPAGREILARRLPVERLRAAFVTHMHADHCGGIFQFVKNLHLYHNHPDYLPQVDEFILAVPDEAVDAVNAFLTATYMFPERMKVSVRLAGIRPGAFYSDENLAAAAIPTTHLEEYRGFLAAHPEYGGPRGQAFAFVLEGEGKRVVYSGDLGTVDDIRETARGADLLVLEFGHLLPIEENLRRLADIGVGRIILTHIFPDYSDRTAELQASCDGVMPGVVSVAEDGLVVRV